MHFTLAAVRLPYLQEKEFRAVQREKIFVPIGQINEGVRFIGHTSLPTERGDARGHGVKTSNQFPRELGL